MEGHPLVGLLGAQYRAAIVEGTLEVSEGHGPWRTVLEKEMGRSEAGQPRGRPENLGEGAECVRRQESGSRSASGQTGGSRGWAGLTGNWQSRYSWESPEQSSSPGSLRGSGWSEHGQDPQEPPPQCWPTLPPPGRPTHIPAASVGLESAACVGRLRVRPRLGWAGRRGGAGTPSCPTPPG